MHSFFHYGRHHVNLYIDSFGGFDDWKKAIWYTDTDSAFTHHKQYLELENAKFSDYLGLLDESLVGYGNEKEEGKLIQYVSDGKGNIKEERETVKEKGNIIGKGVGQFHDDIKEVDEGKIIQQLNDAPKFRIDKIIGISKETPILELLEKTFRDYKPAHFGHWTPSKKQIDKRFDNTIQNFCNKDKKCKSLCLTK